MVNWRRNTTKTVVAIKIINKRMKRMTNMMKNEKITVTVKRAMFIVTTKKDMITILKIKMDMNMTMKA